MIFPVLLTMGAKDVRNLKERPTLRPGRGGAFLTWIHAQLPECVSGLRAQKVQRALHPADMGARYPRVADGTANAFVTQ